MRRTLTLPVLLVLIFSSTYWIITFLNNNEPLAFSVLYRYWDYGYFPLITRILTYGNGEAFTYDSLGQGTMQWPLAGLLPYSFLHKIIGLWGFMVGDIFLSLFRLFAFWFFLKPLKKDERVFLSLFLFFATSTFIVGDFTNGSFVKGLWSTRIPRDLVTSSYLILALGVLIQIPQLLSPLNKSRLHVIIAAIPLCLLGHGDVYSAIAVTLAYGVYIGICLSEKAIKLQHLFMFVIIGIGLMFPFIYNLSKVSADVFARVGRYPIVDHLATFELPYKTHMAVLIFGAIFLSLSKPFLKKFELFNAVFVSWLVFACSLVASPFFSSLTGTGIQEYQYAYRRDQFAGFFLVLCFVFLLRVGIIQYRKKFDLKWLWILLTIPVFVLNMRGIITFSNEFSLKKSAPELQGDGWRNSAKQVYEYVLSRSKQGPLVFATLDHELQFLLLLESNTFSYLMDPQFTPASDDVIIERFLKFCALLKLSDEHVRRLFGDINAHLYYLSGGKFQMNRFYTFRNLSDYPPEAVKNYFAFRYNWDRYIPERDIEDYLLKYQHISSMNLSYRLPQLIIINKNQGSLIHAKHVNEIEGYKKDFENDAFIIYQML